MPRAIPQTNNDLQAIDRALKILGEGRLPTYRVAGLPAKAEAGTVVFVADGRRDGEGAGEGTGTLAVFDGATWAAVATGPAVEA